VEDLKDSLKIFFRGQPFLLVFDGTSRQGELMVTIARTIDEDLREQQHIVNMQTLSYSVNHARLQAILQKVLDDIMGISVGTGDFSIDLLQAIVHDSASVNRAAVNHLVCCSKHDA
jgi:hypothetical protein